MSYWDNKVVAVIGGLGFIGSHLTEELLKRGARVRCIYKKLKDKEEIYSSLRGHKSITLLQADALEIESIKEVTIGVDVLINCASMDGNAKFKKKHSLSMLLTNSRIALNVIEAVKFNSIKSLVMFSSVEVYPNTELGYFTEDLDYKKNFDKEENGYVISKRFGELSSLILKSHTKTRVFIPRLTNVYGPRDRIDPKSGRIIPTLIRRIKYDETVEVWGTGNQRTNFIYVEDAVKAIIRMVEANKFSILNIGTKEQISITELVHRIARLLGKTPHIVFREMPDSNFKNRLLDVSRLYSILDFKPLSLDEGLRKTIAWIDNNERKRRL